MDSVSYVAGSTWRKQLPFLRVQPEEVDIIQQKILEKGASEVWMVPGTNISDYREGTLRSGPWEWVLEL